MNNFTKIAAALLLSLFANFAAAGGEKSSHKDEIESFKDVKSVVDSDDEDGEKADEDLSEVDDNENTGGSTPPPTNQSGNVQPVPVPAALWLMGSGLVGLIGLSRRPKA